MSARLFGLVLLLLLSGCDFQVVTGGATSVGTGGSGTGTGGGGGTGGGSNPTPLPNPVPIPGNPNNPGTRTPDPPQGSILPMPGYAQSILLTVSVPITQCTNYGYLDAVVASLAVLDSRWGYQCRDAACATVSNDRIAYHATAGPDVKGAAGVWTVDIIGSACEAPTPAWQPDGYNATLLWTPRRF